MPQHIRPLMQKNTVNKKAVLHQMLLAAMKCKQTTDLEQVGRLRKLHREFEILCLDGTQ
jgi:hypothetical protein